MQSGDSIFKYTLGRDKENEIVQLHRQLELYQRSAEDALSEKKKQLKKKRKLKKRRMKNLLRKKDQNLLQKHLLKKRLLKNQLKKLMQVKQNFIQVTG